MGPPGSIVEDQKERQSKKEQSAKKAASQLNSSLLARM
jgi:hypothetical protein